MGESKWQAFPELPYQENDNKNKKENKPEAPKEVFEFELGEHKIEVTKEWLMKEIVSARKKIAGIGLANRGDAAMVAWQIREEINKKLNLEPNSEDIWGLPVWGLMRDIIFKEVGYDE